MQLPRVALGIVLMTAGCLIDAPRVHAQWYVSGAVGASESLDAPTTTSPIQSLQLGLLGLTPAGRIQLTGGVPVQPSEDLIWAQAQASTSPFIGSGSRTGFGFQPDLLARGFIYHDPLADINGSGGLLLAEPYAVYAMRSFRMRLGGGARVSGTRAVENGPSAPVAPGPLNPGADTPQTFSTSRTAGVAASDLQFTAASRLTVRARGEVLVFDAGSLPHAEMLLLYGYGRGAVWAGLDRWESDLKRETGWQAGVSLDLMEALVARASVGRTSGDPMFGSPPRGTWSIGLSYRIAARSGDSPGVALPEYGTDGVLLRLPSSAGRGRLSVAGSYNGWKPVPMARNGDDWTIRLDLPAGYYEVAFVDEEGHWFVPEGMNGRRPDGMGGWIMILVVR